MVSHLATRVISLTPRVGTHYKPAKLLGKMMRRMPWNKGDIWEDDGQDVLEQGDVWEDDGEDVLKLEGCLGG